MKNRTTTPAKRITSFFMSAFMLMGLCIGLFAGFALTPPVTVQAADNNGNGYDDGDETGCGLSSKTMG